MRDIASVTQDSRKILLSPNNQTDTKLYISIYIHSTEYYRMKITQRAGLLGGWQDAIGTLLLYSSCGGRRESESLSRCVCRADVRSTSYLLAFTPGAGTSPQWLSRRDVRQGPEHRPEPTKAGNPGPPNDLDHRLYGSGRSGPSLWTGVMVRCYQWLAAANSPASGGVTVLVRSSWSGLSQLLRPRVPAITIWQVYRSRLPKPPAPADRLHAKPASRLLTIPPPGVVGFDWQDQSMW
jgi:hypothetical protein